MKYWITHPGLTPEHDHEIEAQALADWARSGWQVREDQTGPDPADAPPADPREHPVDDPAPAGVGTTPEAPAADEPDTTVPKKKGEV